MLLYRKKEEDDNELIRCENEQVKSHALSVSSNEINEISGDQANVLEENPIVSPKDSISSLIEKELKEIFSDVEDPPEDRALSPPPLPQPPIIPSSLMDRVIPSSLSMTTTDLLHEKPFSIEPKGPADSTKENMEMEGHSFSLHLGNQLDWKPLLSNTQSMTIIPSSMSLPSPPASDPSESFLSFIHDYSPSIYNYECKFVEVKGPHDTLSENQKAWINEMIHHHIPVEVCKVLPLLITPLSLLDCR